jgi:hypothetical protein
MDGTRSRQLHDHCAHCQKIELLDLLFPILSNDISPFLRLLIVETFDVSLKTVNNFSHLVCHLIKGDIFKTHKKTISANMAGKV